MDRFANSYSLRSLPNSGLWFPCHHVFLGTLCPVSPRSILHSFRITWPWLGRLWSASTSIWVIIVILTKFSLVILSARRPTFTTFNNLVHSLEEHHANINRKLVLYPILYLPNSSVLAFPFYLLCMVDWTSHSQAFATHEKIWLFSKRFLSKQEQKGIKWDISMILYTIFIFGFTI